MRLNNKVYIGLVIGLLTICFSGPHGGFIPVFFLQILFLFASIGTTDVELYYAPFLLVLLLLQGLIIFYGKSDISLKSNLLKLLLPISLIDLIIIGGLFLQWDTDSFMIYSVSSITFLLSSAFGIGQLIKTLHNRV